MSLRNKFILYWVLLHVVFAAGVGMLLKEQREWLLAVEALILLSFIIAMRLLHLINQPLKLVQHGAELIRDNFASATFQLSGYQEVDIVLQAYNLMLDKLRKERLRMQEKHFFLEKIMAASPSGIITLDFDDRISMVNPSAGKLLQRQPDSLLGLSLAELPKPFSSLFIKLKESETELITLPNRKVIRCSKSSFFDQGFSRGFLLLEELTEEVRSSEKAAFEKSIRVLSHEMNNSIGAANSLLHSLLHYKSQLHPEDQADFEMALQVVISRTEHLNHFMRSYTNVIRLPDPRPEPVQLKKLVAEIVALFEATMSSHEISLEWNWDAPDDLLLQLDKAQMEQVLVNVFKNAVEAIGSKGKIAINMRDSEQHWLFEIADTGSGISDEAQTQLFSPFFSTKQNGQGIGLALIQEILQRHHLPHVLQNNQKGGVVFSIHFPLDTAKLQFVKKMQPGNYR